MAHFAFYVWRIYICVVEQAPHVFRMFYQEKQNLCAIQRYITHLWECDIRRAGFLSQDFFDSVDKFTGRVPAKLRQQVRQERTTTAATICKSHAEPQTVDVMITIADRDSHRS